MYAGDELEEFLRITELLTVGAFPTAQGFVGGDDYFSFSRLFYRQDVLDHEWFLRVNHSRLYGPVFHLL